MPDQLIDYSDYHRTVIGFHGTTAAAADQLVAGHDFAASDRDDEWFGNGVYFWEHAFQQAWRWARVYKGYESPAVVGAVIRLGNCFDLLDPGNVGVLRAFHDRLKAVRTEPGKLPPQNVRHKRALDCAVFNFLYQELEAAGQPLDTARAVYVPTSSAKRVYDGSWISEETHIQVCVRNPKSILAVWHVRQDGRYGKPGVGDAEGDG